jgi:Ca2+-binding EF-hand superfamily protein
MSQRFEKYDSNSDGVLERSDFESEAAQTARAFGTDVDSPEGQALRRAYNDLFDFQANLAGVGPNGKITHDQFVQANQRLMDKGNSGFDRMIRPLIKALVGICDDNHDGSINQAEYAKWLRAIGVDQSTARSTFSQIDTNGDGELSEDELLDAVREFHMGNLDVPLLGR